MRPTADSFSLWLSSKGLGIRTIKDYMYLFHRFTYDRFNHHNVAEFLSIVKSRFVRSFLSNYQKYLLKHYKELDIDDEYYKEISEVEFAKTGRSPVRLIKPLDEEEIVLIEEHLPMERLKIMLMLSYKSGLRLGGLLGINPSSFNWKEWGKSPEGMGECIVFEKGNKEGIAIVPSHLMKRIARFIRSSDFQGGPHDHIFKMSDRTWQLKLRKAGIDSGLTKFDPDGKMVKDTVVHPHRLRHSLGANLLKKGMNIRYIQEALRHSSIQSTQIYTKLDKEQLKEEMSKINYS